MERRILKAGVALCRTRVERGSGPITAEDLRSMKVRTFSPVLIGFYVAIGLFLVGFSIWVQNQTTSLVIAMPILLIGIGNISFGIYGRPAKVGDLGDGINLMSLTSDIVQAFVKEMDARRGDKTTS